MKRICVFCGSSDGNASVYLEAATKVGEFLVEHEIDLVYGGGRVGLMGRIADAVMSNGGKAFGVIPESLAKKEIAHKGLTELHVVSSMHERKAMMAELSDGFIAMPGGFGTFEEFCEIVTWAQLGIHQKPCGLLNVNGFYDPLIKQFDHSTSSGFVRQEHREIVLVDKDIAELFESMINYVPPAIEKWIDKEST